MDKLILCCAWIAAAILLAVAVFYVPMNMDEAGIFHVLACHDYPFAKLNVFREACTAQNDLILPFGGVLPRPQFYTGLFHTLLYAPFYVLFHAAWAQYLFGFVFLLFFAFSMARLVGAARLTPLFLAFFPFVVQTIHDTGPVKTSLLAFPLTVFLTCRILAPAGIARFLWAAALALAFLCLTEEKPFFLYLLPMLFFFSLAYLPEKIASFWRARGPLALFAGLFLLGHGLLFFAHRQDGPAFIDWLIHLAAQKPPFEEWLGEATQFLFFWPSYAHFTFEIDGASGAGIFFALGVIALTGAFLGMAGRKEENRWRSGLLLASFLAGLLTFALLRNTWAGHHFVFLWVPLLALFAEGLRGLATGRRAGILLAFLLLNLLCVGILFQTPVVLRAGRDKEAVFAYLNDPARSRALVAFASWGGYYIHSLYGPQEQAVTYVEPYEKETARDLPLYPVWAGRLEEIAAQTNRDLYIVCTQPLCNAGALSASFGYRQTFVEALAGQKDWHLFIAKRDAK